MSLIMGKFFFSGGKYSDMEGSVQCPICHGANLQLDNGIAQCPRHPLEIDLRPQQLNLQGLKRRLTAVYEVKFNPPVYNAVV